ncbi:hypothetical protein [Streptomyces sp. NPDC048516]|uniref:hypothetical protein n=1 Tax=Streptomyces sp. NPDC048516 TaxID=3365565 RepID=UPI0037163C2C
MFRRLLESAAVALVTLVVSPLLVLAALHTGCAAAYRVLWERRHLRSTGRSLAREAAAADLAIVTAETLVHDLYETWYSPAPDPHPHVTT